MVTCCEIRASVRFPSPTIKSLRWRYIPTKARVQAVPTDRSEAVNVSRTSTPNILVVVVCLCSCCYLCFYFKIVDVRVLISRES